MASVKTKRLARDAFSRVPVKKRKISEETKPKKKCNEGHSHDLADEFEHGKMDATGWSKYYDSNQGKADHDDKTHECLIKYKAKLTDGRTAPLKILFPMCGQVYDMKYLAELGHDVVGVDYAESAAMNFFERYKIAYKVSDEPSIKGKLYQSTNKKLKVKIYYCDIYKFGRAAGSGSYEAIWDAGAMHSLPKKDLKKYVSAIKPLMTDTCPWLVEFTVPSCAGHSVGQKDIEKIMGAKYTVDDFGITNTKRQSYKKWGVDGFQMFLIKRE